MDNIEIIQINENLQLNLGYVGGESTGGIQKETDPIYTADKPNIALKSEIPVKVSDLQNDSGFISSIPQNLVTQEELQNKGYLTEFTQEDPVYSKDKPNLALKSELFSKSYNDLTEKPDLYTPKSDGDGSKFLADDGTYKTVQAGTDLSDYTGAVKLKLEDGTTFFQRNANINQLRIGNFNTDGTGYNLSSTDIFSNYIQAHTKQFKIQVNNNGELNNKLDVQDGYIQIGVSKNSLIDLYGNYLKWYQSKNSDYPLHGVDFSSATEFKLPENTTINGNKFSFNILRDLSFEDNIIKESTFVANFEGSVVQRYAIDYAVNDGYVEFSINAPEYVEGTCPTIQIMIPYTADLNTFIFPDSFQQINVPQLIQYDSSYVYNYAVFVVRRINDVYFINYSYKYGQN